MPPKKRKAAAAAATKMASQQPAKRVRIGDTSTIGSDSRASTPASGRPRRSTSNDAPQYNFTRKKESGAAETSGGANVKKGQATTSGNNETSPAPKRRGRPPKKSVEAAESRRTPTPKGILKTTTPAQMSASPPNSTPAKRRGRPPKSTASDLARRMTAPVISVSSGKKRGRKAKIEETEDVDMDDVETESDYVNGGANGDGKIDENVQYWLMKAEPDSRMEKGIDVKFSIDDLAAQSEPEGWDGVRNPVARNNMRAMRAGDLAFFYHSNCTTPGIVGIMRIVEEHQLDESAFDPNHPYYDPKSTRDKPKWELVKVEFVKKFDSMMSLKELKSFAGAGGVLENMQTLKQSRLSVSSVQPAEWQFILEQMGERYDLGHVVSDGYESDTDGEVEQGEEGVDDDIGAKTSFETDATDGDMDEDARVLSAGGETLMINRSNGGGDGSTSEDVAAPELPAWPGVAGAEV